MQTLPEGTLPLHGEGTIGETVGAVIGQITPHRYQKPFAGVIQEQ
jgi:hypothetical protein